MLRRARQVPIQRLYQIKKKKGPHDRHEGERESGILGINQKAMGTRCQAGKPILR